MSMSTRFLIVFVAFATLFAGYTLRGPIFHSSGLGQGSMRAVGNADISMQALFNALDHYKGLNKIQEGKLTIFSDLDSGTFKTVAALVKRDTDTLLHRLAPGLNLGDLSIYLFKDTGSYLSFWRSYGARPPSPYGETFINSNLILVNLGLGLGTYAHEITHEIVHHAYSAVPYWLDEGLPCLYETPIYRNGEIQGANNWRVLELQKVMGTENYIPLENLIDGKIPNIWFGDRRHAPAAESKYVLYYLQEEGLLNNFLDVYRKTIAQDRTGKQALENITDKPIAEFEKGWLIWAKNLKFERPNS